MPKRLLVVDDQAGMTKVVSLIATQLGLECRTVNDAGRATTEYVEFKPDIVMLDMIMPEKDGIDVLNEILLSGIRSKIVLTSGYTDSFLRLGEELAKFHDAGEITVLRKPFRRDELVGLLRQLIGDEAAV